jgi:hypothetical protein
MTDCNYTSNNIPIGIGFDSANRPKSLVELSSIEVGSVSSSNVSAISITTSSIQGPNGNTLIINGSVSAVSFIGASGSGASALTDLTDVAIGTLDSEIGKFLYVNGDGLVDAKSVSLELSATYQPLNANLTNISTVTFGPNNILLVNAGGNFVNSNISTFYQSQIQSTNQANARTGLGLGTLATSSNLQLSSLSDVSPYAGSDANYLLVVNSGASGITYIPSSLLVGSSPSAHGSLSELTAVSAHSQYIDISGIHQCVSAITASSTPTTSSHLTNKSYVDTQVSTKQASSINLTAVSNSTSASNSMLYWDTTGQILTSQTSTFGRSLINNSTALETRNALGLSGLATSSVLSATHLGDFQNYNDVGASEGDLLFLDGSPFTIGYKPVSELHHGSLSGLLDDDHVQYMKADGTRAFTAAPSSLVAATEDAHLIRRDWAVTQLALKQGINGLLTDISLLDDTIATGDILYYDGTDIVKLGIGSTGQVLTVVSGLPSWQTPLP